MKRFRSWLTILLLTVLFAGSPVFARGGGQGGGNRGHSGGGNWHGSGSHHSGGNWHGSGGWHGRGYYRSWPYHGYPRYSFYFGFPWAWPRYYDWPYYPYYRPYYYGPPAVVIPSKPPVYIEQDSAANEASPATEGWNYCASSKSYYPHVKECPEGWQQIAPIPEGQEPGYWYYCMNPAGYYPYVPQCSGAWKRVNP